MTVMMTTIVTNMTMVTTTVMKMMLSTFSPLLAIKLASQSSLEH